MNKNIKLLVETAKINQLYAWVLFKLLENKARPKSIALQQIRDRLSEGIEKANDVLTYFDIEANKN